MSNPFFRIPLPNAPVASDNSKHGTRMPPRIQHETNKLEQEIVCTVKMTPEEPTSKQIHTYRHVHLFLTGAAFTKSWGDGGMVG